MFWSKSKNLGAFTIEHHHEHRSVVLITKLDDFDRVHLLLHYFDRQVNLGGQLGADLTAEIDDLVARCYPEVQLHGPTVLPALLPASDWTVVPTASSAKPIIFNGNLLQEPSRTLIDLKVPFFSAVPIQPVAVAGTRALLIDALRTGTPEARFYLLIGLGKACEVFRAGGIPGAFGFGRASHAALELIGAVASKMGSAP